MNKVKLGEIAELITKGTTPTSLGFNFQESGINFIKIESISEEGQFFIDKFAQISTECHEKLKRSQLKENDVLFSIAGAIGRVAVVNDEILPANTNQALAIIRIPKGIIDYQFLALLLKSEKITSQYNRKKQGVAQINLSLKDISELEIVIPDVEVQKQIIEKIYKIDDIIYKTEQQIINLDILIKSRFVEMFGDWFTNPNKYKTDKLESHIDIISGYPFESSLYVEEGINICGGLIILPHYINWNECKHWNTTIGFEEYMLDENDIVMALDRPWISEGFKISKIDRSHLPALLIQRTARIRAKDINQEYLYYCFDNCGFERHCNVTGSLVPHISLKDIKSFVVMLPPIELQNQFADFVTKVEQQKATVQKSIEKLETLKRSLMQEYFGGA